MQRTDLTPVGGRPRQALRRAFTLVELLVAMVVLVILMGMLFAIVGGAQNAYSLSDSNAQIYEKAHIVFELLSRDLRSAVASEIPGRQVPVWVNPAPDPTNVNQRDLVCVVVAGEASDSTAVTRHNKVKYAFHTVAAQAGAYKIARSSTDDTDASGWTFYGVTQDGPDTDSDGIPDWVDTSEARQSVVGGVETFTIVPHPAFTGTRNRLPQAFIVTLTLVDERALSLAEPVRQQRLDQSRRTFRKIVFVGGEI
jgi:prepilin-type N-terminal cleavage/methylation domain-containing protein